MQKFTYKGEDYYWTGSEWLTATFIRPPKVIESTLNREHKDSITAPVKHTPSHRRQTKQTDTIQAHIAPEIAEIIHRQFAKTNQFVTRAEIVAGLVDRPEIKDFLQEAHAQTAGHYNFVEYVGNQVDFFSKNMTQTTSEYADEFEQTKIDNKWAYKPTK